MPHAAPPLRVTTRAADVLRTFVRRQIWRRLFAPRQRALGRFFLDPSDHIGIERLVAGDRYEAHLLQLLAVVIDRLGLGAGTALDVGANIGNHAQFFASRFRFVYCVEPGKIAGHVLTANLLATGRNNFRVIHCALGDRVARGRLAEVRAGNLGSSTVDTIDAVGDFDIVPGDQLAADIELADLQLVKVDVEGLEPQVMTGLRATLGRQQPLLCVEILEAERLTELRGILEPLGYRHWLAPSVRAVTGTAVGRLRALLGGREYALAPVAATFPRGGYDMVFCLTDAHWARLENPPAARVS